MGSLHTNDVNNHKIDNANDNSASVINAIMIKKLMPEMNVILPTTG